MKKIKMVNSHERHLLGFDENKYKIYYDGNTIEIYNIFPPGYYYLIWKKGELIIQME